MIDLTTYALLRKQIASAASGISDVRAEGDELVFVLVDGHEVRMAIPATEIRDAVVRDDVLVLTLEDDKEIVVDATLTQSGQAADAAATGAAISQLSEEMANKVTNDFGAENAGAPLIVGADGKISVLHEESGEEVEVIVAPARYYENGEIYLVKNTNKLFVSTGAYSNVAAYQVHAGKKYRFDGYATNGKTDTYVFADALYDRPDSGYGTAANALSYHTETELGVTSYEVTAEADGYLYVQIKKGITDAYNNMRVVTGGNAGGSVEYPRYAVAADGNGIEISYPYAEDTLTVTLNKRGGNNLFDFRKIETNTEKLFDASSSDWHAPFVVAAVNNADGDTPENQYFTGGNHQTNNTGTGGAVTARTSALQFYADGKLLSAGDAGNAIKVEMRWTNLVQGYNTTKADGNGREILQENHTLTFANGKFETYVEVIPLEAVTMKTWYGLQAVVGSKYPNIRYPGGTNRGEYEGNSESGDSTACVMDCYGDAHRMRIAVDPVFDLGKRSESFAIGTKGAFSTDYGKCYFTIVNKDVSMAAGDMYCLRGSYEFTPR